MAIWDLIYKSLTTPHLSIVDEEDQKIARRSASKPPIKVNLPLSPYAPRPKVISKANFEALIIPRAQLMAAGGQVNAMHYSLARQQLLQELAANNTVVQNGPLGNGDPRRCIIRKRVLRGPNAYAQMLTMVCNSGERGADREAGGHGKI